ncbi:MAG: amino acid permease, partial [Crocinitomicaceae bacterium]|nr:amino acid permease [Crocinitomicaceae bacterium]
MSSNSLFRKKTVEGITAQLNLDKKNALAKHLTFKDLTLFGIAAIVGAGIFSTIGTASFDGGPAVILLFIFTALACGFTALSYAEFASMVPVAGSAYTYAYVAFGELVAWVIGWALIMEYAIGNITVAISWSDYFTSLLDSMQLNIPYWLRMDYRTASEGFLSYKELVLNHKSISPNVLESYQAIQTAPRFLNFPIIFDLPAIGIIVAITALVYKGIKESKTAGNLMVYIKFFVLFLVIVIGVFFVDVKNWSPFAPNGMGGLLKGISAVFFAYIGFDAISTTAEECKNPQKDLPRAMLWSIVICTIIYVVIALILTGVVNYTELNVGDPLAFVFDRINMPWLSGVIAVSAVVAMASVLLVFQMGQPRIWLSMSRDGLLPKKFSTIHPKFKTPSFATIVTGFVVAIPTLFLNLKMVTDLCSIGTLFAFTVVCAGVLVMNYRKTTIQTESFKTPFINARYVLPVFSLLII